MIGSLLLACVAAGVVLAMIGIWFPKFFSSDTGAKFLASSVAILISALIAGFILWVV